MFFEAVADEWGDILLYPTKAGQSLLTIMMAFFILIGMIGMQFYGHKVSIRKLAYCVFAIGVAAVLANFSINFGSYGGTVTMFAMLAIVLPAYWYGPIAGIAVGLAYGILQILIDPYMLFPAQIVVDYGLAFGSLGLAGFFSKSSNGLLKGYILGVFGRYFFAVLSGAVFFGAYAWEGWNPVMYSIVYNALYLLPEAVITIIFINIPKIKEVLEKLRLKATENEGMEDEACA